MSNCVNYLRLFYFTYFSFVVYGLKIICDQIIAVLLGLLLVIQNVNSNVLKILYIIAVVIIIIAIMADKVLRENSKTFDLLRTLTGPINIGPPMKKIVDYRWKTHALQCISLFLIELIKISAAVYCIIVITIEKDFVDPLLNYILLGILLFDSVIAAVLYLSYFCAIIIMDDFYYTWLKYFSEWYLNCVINVIIKKEGTILTVEFGPLMRCPV